MDDDERLHKEKQSAQMFAADEGLLDESIAQTHRQASSFQAGSQGPIAHE
jgi:hypothetical protein